MNVKLISSLCTQNQVQLMKMLKKYLVKRGYSEEKIIYMKDYILAEGDLPVALICHLDTVSEDFYQKTAEGPVIYDPEQDLLHVLGGCTLDDRLGLYAVIQIIEAGFRPSLIFTRGEETGGDGAHAIAARYNICPFVNLNFMVELDRQGKDDAVFYTCGNRDFQRYITSFGFKMQKGTFTDCLILGEAWNVAAVNLSIGYINEHSIYEVGKLEWTHETIDKVCAILSDCGNVYKYDKAKLNLFY